MTVRLRPHHLLCLLTYVGKGYSPAFIAGLTAIAKRIDGGEDVVIVHGPDDICTPMLDDPTAHCRNATIDIRDAAAAYDVGKLLGRGIRAGIRLSLTPDIIAQMRKGFAKAQTRSACVRCDWADLCTDIAGNGYQGAVLQAGAKAAG